jgi:hypothetical protein
MKRRGRTLSLAVLCALVAGFAVDVLWDWHIRKGQEKTYQTTLRSYSTDLKPGATRKGVEEYLRTRSLAFQQRSAESDLFLIGKGRPDWVCSQKNEYLAFHFTPAPQGVPWKAKDADTLTRIDLHFEGRCL